MISLNSFSVGLLENKKDTNIPFCICWANENWTRRWDGFDDDVLMQQNHSAEDMIAVFRDIEKYILDDRYIRIGGKPLVLIYRPDLIPDVRAMMEIWRDEARKLGLQGLYLIAAKAFGMESAADLGLDGLYDFPPHGHTVPYGDHTVKWFDPAHKGHVLSYRDVVESAIERIKTTDDETFQGALVGWDTEARKPGRGEVLHGATPRDFRRWLEAVCLKLQDKADPEKRIVFINAWNEWAEGAHLEPDRRHGYGFLTALRSVMREFGIDVSKIKARCANYNQGKAKQSDYVIIVHIFYFDLVDEISRHIKRLNASLAVDIIVTVPEIWSVAQVDTLIATLQPRLIFATKNIGRDVFPFLLACRTIAAENYKFACKLHSKKSTHRIDGALWRNDLFNGLTGDDALRQLESSFFRDEKAGLAAPAHSLLPLANQDYIAGNHEHFAVLAQMLDTGAFENSLFVAGTMFWFRFDCLRPVFDLPLGEFDFGVDLGQVDGTLAHAFERLFYFYAEDTGQTNLHLKADFSFTIDFNSTIKEKSAVL